MIRMLLLLFILLPLGVYSQDIEDEQMAKWMEQYENAVIDLISKNYLHRIKLERHAEYVAVSPGDVNVAILGQSADAALPDGFNSEKLTSLLELIRTDNPKAVFFNGNLVFSLDDDPDVSTRGEALILPVEKNIFGEEVEDYGLFNSAAFQSALAKFRALVAEVLGPDIPFYPIMGVQESIGPDALEIFRKEFGLDNAQVLVSNQLVYTVPVNTALFVLISTDYYNKETNEAHFQSLSEPLWEWLRDTMTNDTEKYPFRFVIGSEPAFSTTAPFNTFQGLDQNTKDRNRFWNQLIESKTRAYFSGGEVLYDRSYRYGIWQIITGGAGRFNQLEGRTENVDDTFYHYVLMTLPAKPTQDPIVQVFDDEGERKDKFVLSKNPPFLFNLRISKQSASMEAKP